MNNPQNEGLNPSDHGSILQIVTMENENESKLKASLR
jgi:hypothetical protein